MVGTASRIFLVGELRQVALLIGGTKIINSYRIRCLADCSKAACLGFQSLSRDILKFVSMKPVILPSHLLVTRRYGAIDSPLWCKPSSPAWLTVSSLALVLGCLRTSLSRCPVVSLVEVVLQLAFLVLIFFFVVLLLRHLISLIALMTSTLKIRYLICWNLCFSSFKVLVNM